MDGRTFPALDRWESGAHADSVVVGAGLTGLVTALLLARAGMSVTVLEAHHVGALTTGRSTAKLSLLQGGVLSSIRRHFSARVVDAYVAANREGQAWMLRYLAENDVPVQRRDAFTFARTAEGVADLDREFEVARAAGLDVERTDEPGLPFRTHGALRLADQAQLDPIGVVLALTADLRARGVRIVERTRVRDVDDEAPATVVTDRGEMTADQVVLATGTPILDRGLYFAKLVPLRSYAAAYRVPGDAVPRGMYLSIDAPTRSLRTAEADGRPCLLVGGNGHIVGRAESAKARLDELDAWTRESFPGAERTHWWSAQDYRSVNRVPFVGSLPRGRGRIFVATGYGKWGMTNAVAAALTLSAEILGGQLPWADTLHHRVTHPATVGAGARFNAGVVREDLKGWVHAETARPEEPAEGQGTIRRRSTGPVAVSRVDGACRAVSAVCTHLGGIVTWNDAERTWDCPLHGSRFRPDGARIEGPATEDLAAEPG
jgi:glycine/D-amino acid oxidase-like deaminating enzyme/nitrite reductase/ring-hydroxylating ferredoxin subunit